MNAYRDGTAIIAPRRAEGPDAIGDAWIRLEPGTAEYQVWDEWLNSLSDEGASEQRAGGRDIAEEGHDYWVHGKGLAKWADAPDPWTELHAHLIQFMDDEEAKRTAAQWFHEVFHFWPGSDVNRVTHGHPPRGEKVGPG